MTTYLYAQLEGAGKKLFSEDDAKTPPSGDYDKNFSSEDNAKTLPRGGYDEDLFNEDRPMQENVVIGQYYGRGRDPDLG